MSIDRQGEVDEYSFTVTIGSTDPDTPSYVVNLSGKWTAYESPHIVPDVPIVDQDYGDYDLADHDPDYGGDAEIPTHPIVDL